MLKVKKFNIEYSAKFSSEGKKNNILFWLLSPSDSFYQKIDSFLVNHQYVMQYKDNENEVLYFQDSFTDKYMIKINILGTFTKDVITKSSPTLANEHNKNLKKYTKSEKYLEQTSEIKILTKKVLGGARDDMEKVRKIFDFIASNFVYEYPVLSRGVKQLDLENLRGDCAEYSSLFVTMCRISGIMSRNVTGFVIFEKERTICEHGWAQVYTENKKWVDVDPQYASLEKKLIVGTRKYFMNRFEYRLITSIGFNIKVKPTVGLKYKIDYDDNLDIGMKRNCVQVLQPIAFATEKNVIFESKISII